MDNPKIVFEKISYYLGTVIFGLLIHGVIVLPLLFIVITKKNIFVYAKNMFEALLVAFVTSSRLSLLIYTLISFVFLIDVFFVVMLVFQSR